VGVFHRTVAMPQFGILMSNTGLDTLLNLLLSTPTLPSPFSMWEKVPSLWRGRLRKHPSFLSQLG
jgi:hypothetical protein